MRLWTLHPKHLDPRGIVALWREALLARQVLAGKTKRYRSHPQLVRFRSSSSPRRAIEFYLWVVYEESVRRGYQFDRKKVKRRLPAGRINVTADQLHYEWRHLKRKVHHRDSHAYRTLKRVRHPEHHPLFRIVPGPVEPWEKL